MLIAIVVFCVLLEAVFTALEVALGAIPRARLRGLTEVDGESTPKQLQAARRARRTLRTLDHAPRVTLLFIIVTSLSMWAAASLLTWQSLLGQWPAWSLPLALVATLFVAEVLPVLIAAPRAEAIVLRGTALIEGASTLLAPLIWLVGGAGRGLAQLLGAGRETTPQVTEDELRSALAAAEEEGAIESNERALLEGAMDFRAKIVREVMTSRLDVVGVAAGATLHDVLSLAIKEGHSRLPVYDGTLDNILGIVSTKDLIPHLRQSNNSNGTASAPSTPAPTARDIVRPAYFVAADKLIAATLDDLRQQRTLMAVVRDGDGSTAGIVTLEDLLEEIVGDIHDEYDQAEPPQAVPSPQLKTEAA